MKQDDTILAANFREVTGKKVKNLRLGGIVPAVVYDHGKTSHISVEDLPMRKIFRIVGRSQPLELELDGKRQLAMVKQVDLHPVKHTFRHVAFQAVKRNERVSATVSIRIALDEGNDQAPAERLGLIVLRSLESAEIKALPKDLPEELTVNGEGLHAVGDRLTLADITLPAGVEFADHEVDLDQVIASVYEPSAIAAANDAAGGDVEDTTEASAAEAVDADHGEDTNQVSNDGENRPGGKKEFEKKGQ